MAAGLAELIVNTPGAPGALGAPSATYHGNAGLEGATVAVGGADRVVGGWAAHHAAKRAVRREGAAPNPELAAHYPGRTYISAEDAVVSLLAAGQGPGNPLAGAAERLAAALERLQERQTSGAGGELLVVPALAPSNLRELDAEIGLEALQDVARRVGAVAPAGCRAPPPPPPEAAPLPLRAVSIGDFAAISRLEDQVLPHAAAVENYRALLAEYLDSVSCGLEQLLAAS
jgi:hypothetical protein